ncbi:MAG: hypothetical protein KDB80_11070 [Planctomycetes bacterium]|nr:hypothetical protein [Planctomycetota bacterium]
MASRIPAGRVVKVAQAAVVASGTGADTHPITVIPLVDGEELCGLEIRCRCGAQAVVDCVYDGPDATAPARTDADVPTTSAPEQEDTP